MSDYDFTNITQTVTSNQNIKQYKIEFLNSSNNGDGFTSSIRAIKITSSDKTLNLIYKYLQPNSQIQEKLPIYDAYLKEIKLYEEIIPSFINFQLKHQVKNIFNNTAKYYGCVNESTSSRNNLNSKPNVCFALENLKLKNYDLWNRQTLINEEHIKLTLETLAKFHGTSMAMKTINPNQYQQLISGIDKTKYYDNSRMDFIQKANLYQQLNDHLISLNLQQLFNETTEQLYIKKLEFFRKNLKTIMDPVILHHDQHDVILQGDCWNNNIMYQYKNLQDRTKPENVIFLDWQILCTGNLIIDLTFFLYPMASKECLDNLEYYQKIYHKALTKHLEEFELDVQDIYPYELFYEQWKKLAVFGLMEAFIMRKMMLMDEDQEFDFGQHVDSFLSVIQLSINQELKYKEQMKDLLKHFVDNQFL